MVVVNMIDVFEVLRKETDKVRVFSYRLTWQFEVILSQVETVHVAVTTSGIISLTFVLSF